MNQAQDNTSAQLALAMWSDLDDIIVEKIKVQGQVLKRFIESNPQLFLEVEVFDYGTNQVVSMFQMLDIFMSYYYRNGSFYHWEGMEQTGRGYNRDNCPRVVHLVEGKKLQEFLRDKDFVSSFLETGE